MGPTTDLIKLLHCQVTMVLVAFKIAIHRFTSRFLTLHCRRSATFNFFLLVIDWPPSPEQDELVTSVISEQVSLYLLIIDTALGVIFPSA
mgnify:CR=1 FL=1